MNAKQCAQELAVARMIRTGLPDELLERHARECAVCGEVAAAARAMQLLARADDAPAAALPDASLLWWKHELLERYKQREKAARPVRFMETLTATLAIAALGVAITIFSLTLPDDVDLLSGQWLLSLIAMATTGAIPQTLVSVAAGAAAIGAGIIYPLWPER